MRNLFSLLFFILALLSITWSCQSGSRGMEWTHFRGSNLDGISDAKISPGNQPWKARDGQDRIKDHLN